MFFSRGKNKVQDPYTIREIYQKHLAEVEEDSPYNIPYNTIVSIYKDFYEEVMQHIFEGGLYHLPHGMGELSVLGVRPKKFKKNVMSVDWASTLKAGKKIYHLNDHSNYIKYRFHWSKTRSRMANKSNYRLVMTRDHKRNLAKIIKSGDYQFFER